MRIRLYVLLAVLGTAVSVAVASFQAFPGYLDSDYYFGGGLQLAAGKGFTEPYVWNYLDDPAGLPHPSHTYWMPLASLISAAGMWLTRQHTYASGRLGFLLLAALVPVLTAALAYQFRRRQDLALISGLLAVFSGYYAPFLPVTDNYGADMILGAMFFMLMLRRRPAANLAIGLVAGLLSLGRTDGLLWLVGAVAVILWRDRPGRMGTNAAPEAEVRGDTPRNLNTLVLNVGLALVGFALVMGPWFWRMYSLFGTIFAPGAGHLLWLRNYDETFVFPASQLTPAHWLSEGWGPILVARLGALRWNLLNAFAAEGGLVIAPFVLGGLWLLRRDLRVKVACLAWLALLGVMTVVFPFAGARGGFFHSGAALQPTWWVAAPIGLEAAIAWARGRGLFSVHAFVVFRAALVGAAVLLTAGILYIRVLPGWGEGEQQYPRIQAFLHREGLQVGDTVMVRNPPGYFIMTGQPAVVVPYGGASSMLEVARQFQVAYVILEAAGAAGPIKQVYEDTHNPELPYLGEIDGTRIFTVRP
jgi:hypothetical protein